MNQYWILNVDGDKDLLPLIGTKAARNDLSRSRTLMRNGHSDRNRLKPGFECPVATSMSKRHVIDR